MKSISSPVDIRWLALVYLLLLFAGLIASLLISSSTNWLPIADSEAGKALLKNYNEASHFIFLTLLSIACIILIRKAQEHNNKPKKNQKNNLDYLITSIKQHPFVTGLFAFYTALMLQQASWFYKEIISWYKDIFDNHLLDNFTLRWDLIKETMFRNDFRFYPLSHQDLHILSWLTPYVSIWMIVNAIELFTIVILGAKIAHQLSEKQARRENVLLFSILFLFDAATGFTFFQFIYSERIVVLLFAFFAFHYIRHCKQNQAKDRFLAVFFALLGLFFKDTAFLLFIIPALTVLAAGSAGLLANKPKFSRHSIDEWAKAYQLEFCLCGLIIILSLSYLYLSYIPSLYAGVKAYDSYLRFSRFEPDARFIVLILTSVIRLSLIIRRKASFSLLDALNASAITYAFGLYAMVGFRSSNYMALPVQFIATINLMVLWIWATESIPASRGNLKTISLAGVIASSCLIGAEHLGRDDFHHRIVTMRTTHDSWVKTLDQLNQITKKSREKGEEVNIIYAKSWFRNRGPLERLNHDRLIYFDFDSNKYTIMHGTDKGSSYIPQKGDFLVNIDTGTKRFEQFKFDMTPYRKIYDYSPDESNGMIYRRIR